MALSAGGRIGPFEIVSTLGSGGMGVVYKAWDTRLNRLIALKTLSGEKVSDTEERRRFLIEIQAVSRLNHPNIITIHESLEDNGVCFLVMEYVSGSTMERLLANQSLSVGETMNYAAQIADGLASVHSAGIIHRDLKPANIMVTDEGWVKVLDFGLASFSVRALPGDVTVTMQTVQGTVLGTAPYMSPEQVNGRTADARSDIFSYGCVLYEMLAGKPAFRRETWAATVAAVLSSDPTPLRELRPGIPAILEQVILRCLCKAPEERFQTVVDLKRTLAGVSMHSADRGEKASIAVLPFSNLSADKENEYFSDGLAEEVINALTKIPELKVIARGSSFAFRGHEHNVRAIGQKLRVGTILEGSVRRAGGRIRVSAHLIRVEDESHLWSERYDRELTDVFAIQDGISHEIASALKVRLAPPGNRPANSEAYQSYLKGIYWYQRYTAHSLALAKESFELALKYDPAYAPAHAGLAVFYYSIGALSIQRMSDVGPLARAAAEKALAIDQDLSEAHSVLGLLAGAVEYDWAAAAFHFQSAMAVDPVPSLVRMRYSLYYLLPLGRYGEAVLQYDRALETDPLSMMVLFGRSFALYCDRRYEEAIERGTEVVHLYPDYWLVHFVMGMSQSQTGRTEEAITSFETGLQLSPLFALATSYLAALHGRSGRKDKAETLMAELAQRRQHAYVSSSAFAIYYAAVGEADLMFEHLYAALAEREPFLTRMDAEPYFWPYRDDTRYRELLLNMRLG